MKVKKHLFCTLILLFNLSSCFEEDGDLNWQDSGITYFSKIYSESFHCAFTDLIKYNNYYYCTFREANAHLPSKIKDYGKIRILKSTNGEDWTSAGFIEDSEYDLRDPHFSITPNNKLMITYGKSSFNEQMVFCFKYTGFSLLDNLSNGDINNIETYDVDLGGRWLWRNTWHNNILYGVAYLDGVNSSLMRSTDGKKFKEITTFNLYNTNEADIIFSENDMMNIVIRSNSSNGYLGEASPPYKHWEWKELNYLIYSPKLIKVEENLILLGKGGFDKGRKFFKNILYNISDKKINPLYIFPGDRDTGYPGAMVVGDELWVSYHTTFQGITSIYLAKILISDINRKIESQKQK